MLGSASAPAARAAPLPRAALAWNALCAQGAAEYCNVSPGDNAVARLRRHCPGTSPPTPRRGAVHLNFPSAGSGSAVPAGAAAHPRRGAAPRGRARMPSVSAGSGISSVCPAATV